ncbi:MAG TPA: iron-containing redox enzyme family protein [Mycobacteriales bacterium]|nr:iron-containing redox enzyme family protein [Mycobacteriales bacterium]
MTTALSRSATPLADTLHLALQDDDTTALDALTEAVPDGPRDRFTTLLTLYSLHTAPVDTLGPAARHQHRPSLAALKNRCESDWLDELASLPAESGDAELSTADGLVAAMRTLAARDRLPTVYKWIARDADWDDVVRFLALEGGPDAGFDDLVAACQIGLTGSPKMELAVNYWDEMGNGDPAAVHTTLHDQLVSAIAMPRIPTTEQPVSALARSALGGLLTTNRWLQPEMLGALGLIELQAGPRCRLVLNAFDRCGAPDAAYPFYEVHAEVDPRHGKDWLEKAIVPTVTEHPEWGERILRGAAWRSAVNAAFLDDVAGTLGVPSGPADVDRTAAA